MQGMRRTQRTGPGARRGQQDLVFEKIGDQFASPRRIAVLFRQAGTHQQGRDSRSGHRGESGAVPGCTTGKVAELQKPAGYRRSRPGSAALLQPCVVGYASRSATQASVQVRLQRDDVPGAGIERVWQANMQVYGADRVWRHCGVMGGSVDGLLRQLSIAAFSYWGIAPGASHPRP